MVGSCSTWPVVDYSPKGIRLSWCVGMKARTSRWPAQASSRLMALGSAKRSREPWPRSAMSVRPYLVAAAVAAVAQLNVMPPPRHPPWQLGWPFLSCRAVRQRAAASRCRCAGVPRAPVSSRRFRCVVLSTGELGDNLCAFLAGRPLSLPRPLCPCHCPAFSALIAAACLPVA